MAGGAAAELETWNFLPAVCPTSLSDAVETAVCPGPVAVKHKLSLCSWGTLGVFLVENNLSPDSYPRFIPDSYPESYPSLPFAAKSLLRSGQY